MSEPRRWWISDSTANRIEPLPSIKHLYVEVMAVEDHDRIMAELRAEVERLELVAKAAVECMKERDLTIARQARVIEKLKAAIEDVLHERYSDDDVSAAYSDPLMVLLTAIEKQGEGV